MRTGSRLVRTRDVAEVGRIPARLERFAPRSHDQERGVRVHGSGAASNRGVGDRERGASVEPNLLAVDLEDGSPFEDQVQLLLAARLLVVLLDEQLVGTIRDEE